MLMDIKFCKRVCILMIYILLLIPSLLGCELYDAPEQLRKIDSKEGRKELSDEAYDLNQVKAQKRKDLLPSYKLDGGLRALQDLDIVKTASIEKNKIEVNFLIKDMENNKKDSIAKEKIVWGNVLFLYYTIYDTFPEIEDIYLTADYYFLDQYGQPYKERVFISNVSRNQLKRINRDYLRSDMVSGLIDFYMSEYLMAKETKAEK